MPLLPPEARLLLLVTAPWRTNSDAELASLVEGALNWEMVARLAEREKLLPILWNVLHKYTGRIPPEMATSLRRRATVADFRMAMTETALRRVVAQLAAANIRVMLLKGAALATTIYPSFANRPMGDLDILVAPADAQRAWTMMREAGWRLELRGGAEFHDSHHHLPGLLDPEGLDVVLEIHRAMLPSKGPFSLSDAELWRDAQSVQLGATEVWVPSHHHELLHLCVHFAWSHALIEGVGRTVRDVSMLLESGSTHWPAFIDLANRTKAATCVYWTLAMTQTLSGAAVPADVLEELRPRLPKVMTNALERAFVTSGLLRACPSIHLSRWLWSAGILPTESGHGAARPWHVSEMFEHVFHVNPPQSLGGRFVAQASHFTDWIQFAEVVGVPRRLL